MDIVDLHQRSQIKATRTALAASQNIEQGRHQAMRDEVARLEERVDRLRLAAESMWILLKETTGLTEEHLIHKIHQLDALDGSVDGKRRERATECGCGAMVNARSQICVFCGAAAPSRTVFDRI